MKKIKTVMMLSALIAQLVHADTQRTIHDNAALKWPRDIEMQRYEVKQQTDALHKWEGSTRVSGVPNDVVEKIRTAAADKWGDDYVMRVYEQDTQIAAWKKLNKK